MRHWNWQPREAIEALSLQMFKAKLEEALSSLMEWMATQSTAVGVDLNDL